MEVDLLGGFGEKGRTSLAVSNADSRILLDFGIKVGAGAAEYYPALAGGAKAIDAVFISHAHEDHVGGLSRLMGLGYEGPIYMTRETREETPSTLANYADPQDCAAFPFAPDRVRLFEPGDTIAIGELTVRTGRSGHVVGGVWFAAEDDQGCVAYSADVVPHSGVFVMDPIPECDLLILDASYGADRVPGTERASRIAEWVAKHQSGCLLPTPLSGRSLELIAALPGRFAIHASMRASLEAQSSAMAALLPQAPDLLRSRLEQAVDWNDGDALPALPLLADDGMGTAGPSERLIPRADEAGFPVLLTGHLPAGSPADLVHKAGRAQWMRMPTHPTLADNFGIWQGAGKPTALGHSCEPGALDEIKAEIPAILTDCRTGQSIKVMRKDGT